MEFPRSSAYYQMRSGGMRILFTDFYAISDTQRF